MGPSATVVYKRVAALLLSQLMGVARNRMRTQAQSSRKKAVALLAYVETGTKLINSVD